MSRWPRPPGGDHRRSRWPAHPGLLIERLGFSVVDPDVDFDPDPPVLGIAALPDDESGFECQPAMPNIVDWDQYDAERLVLFPCHGSRQAA